MFNLDKFIADGVTKRAVCMFVADIEANKGTLTREIRGKRRLLNYMGRENALAFTSQKGS